jgi:hypothetical protein
MGVDQDDENIDIEKMIREVALRVNQTVISFLDCCRNEAFNKGGEDVYGDVGTFYGRFITVYTVQPGKKEFIFKKDELSPGTEKMVSLINKY